MFGDGTQSRSFTYVGDVVRRYGSLDRRAARDRPGLQYRQRQGDLDRRAGRQGQGDDRQQLGDRADPLRPGLRGGLRGHAAARARHREDSARSSATSRPSSSTRSSTRVIEYFRSNSPTGRTRASRPARAAPPRPRFAARRSRSAGCCSRRAATASPILPEIVQIESTNICNAKCVFCPRDDMHRRQGVMSFELFKKIVDECAELGITHVRVHNYGEPFIDRQLVEKVRYAKQKGIKEVGMISNGSLITEEVARGMIEAGLDAINISVDAGGKEVFEPTRIGLNYDKVIANIERLVRIRAELGQAAAEADPVASSGRTTPPTSRRSSSTGGRRRQDSHHRPAQLGRHAEPRIRRQLPVLPAVADLHGPVGRPRVALLRRLRRPDDPRRPEHVDDRGDLERRALPCQVRRAAPRERRPDICRACDLPRRTPRSGSPSSSRPAAFRLLLFCFFRPFRTAVQLDPSSYQAYTGSLPAIRAQTGLKNILLRTCFRDSSSPPASWPRAPASPASAGELKLTMQDGRVTIVAERAAAADPAEWARVGQTKIVNADKLHGPPDHAAAGRRARGTRARHPAALGQRLTSRRRVRSLRLARRSTTAS